MNCAAGWVLVLSGIVLLAVLNRLDSLVVLVPLAVVVACGCLWIGHRGGGAATRLK